MKFDRLRQGIPHGLHRLQPVHAGKVMSPPPPADARPFDPNSCTPASCGTATTPPRKRCAEQPPGVRQQLCGPLLTGEAF